MTAGYIWVNDTRPGFLWVLLPVMLAVLTTGCGGHHGAQPGTTNGDGLTDTAPLTSGDAFPVGLPLDETGGGERLNAAGHVVAADARPEFAPFATYQNGMLYHGCSSGLATQSGTALRLDAAPAGSVAWAIYRLGQEGIQPGVVCADLNAYFGTGQPPGEYWAGLADYARGSWEWHGPFTENHLLLQTSRGTTAGADYLSELGNTFVCIVVTGGAAFDVVGVGATRPGEPTTPPAAPTGFSASAIFGGIDLQWDDLSGEDITGYALYYSHTAFSSTRDAGVERRDNPAAASGCTLEITGTTYAGITAVDAAGTESELSAVIQVAPEVELLTPVTLTISAPSCSIGDELQLAASGSTAYSWDLDGDGTFEVSESSNPETTLTAVSAGVLRPRVRGSSSDGSAVAYAGVGCIASRTEWSMFGYDEQHTHRTPVSGPASPGLIWRFLTTGSGDGLMHCAQAPDGSLYVVSVVGSTLYKITPTGEEIWSADLGGLLQEAPGVGPDGSVYALVSDTQLTALDSDGNLKWTYAPAREARSEVRVGSDGAVYFIDEEGWLYVLNADGTERLVLPVSGEPGSAAVPAADGTIYFGTMTGKYQALNPDGSLKWEVMVITGTHIPPVIAPDGTIYLAPSFGRLYSVNPDGTQQWYLDDIHTGQCEPVVAGDGTIYLMNTGGFTALNSDGTEKWIYPAIGDGNLRPALTADGRIIFGGCPDGGVYCLNPDGTLAWTGITGHYLRPGWLHVDEDHVYFLTRGVPENLNDRLHAINLDGTADWTWGTGGEIYSSPAVGPDGTIYCTSRDGMLYALNPDGTRQWDFPTTGQIDSSPAVDPAGTIYFVSSDGNLYAVHPDGTERWTCPVGGSSSPVIDPDGYIYAGDADGGLVAIDWDGGILWQVELQGTVESSPALTADGAVVIGLLDGGTGSVVVTNPDGTNRWSATTAGSPLRSSPMISGDGAIHIGGQLGYLTALDSDGGDLWALALAAGTDHCPAAGLAGTIYLGDAAGVLHAISAAGAELWTCNCSGAISSAASIDGDGTIYVATGDTLYALNPDGTELWSTPFGGSIGSAPVISSSGRIYVGSGDKHLYCFGDE